MAEHNAIARQSNQGLTRNQLYAVIVCQVPGVLSTQITRDVFTALPAPQFHVHNILKMNILWKPAWLNKLAGWVI